MDDAIDFEVVAEKDKPKSYDIEYKTLSADQVRQAMKADVEHIVSMLGLEVSTTLIYRLSPSHGCLATARLG